MSRISRRVRLAIVARAGACCEYCRLHSMGQVGRASDCVKTGEGTGTGNAAGHLFYAEPLGHGAWAGERC
jgi:hypothetical protein